MVEDSRRAIANSILQRHISLALGALGLEIPLKRGSTVRLGANEERARADLLLRFHRVPFRRVFDSPARWLASRDTVVLDTVAGSTRFGLWSKYGVTFLHRQRGARHFWVAFPLARRCLGVSACTEIENTRRPPYAYSVSDTPFAPTRTCFRATPRDSTPSNL